jgi:hypothetical protein
MPRLVKPAAVVGLGSLSLVASLLDYRILVMIAFVMIVFWCGVVLPAVWSRSQKRRKDARALVAVLLGRKADDQKPNDQKQDHQNADDQKRQNQTRKDQSKSG